MDPSSSVKVTCISKQYFILGWLDGGLLAGDHSGEWEGELSSSSDPIGPLHLELALPTWPST